MVFEKKLSSVLGTVELTYQISRNAKFPKRKYMGMWSWVSRYMWRTVTVFPMKATVKMAKTRWKRKMWVRV